jgi:hypothetical protein
MPCLDGDTERFLKLLLCDSNARLAERFEWEADHLGPCGFYEGTVSWNYLSQPERIAVPSSCYAHHFSNM